MRDTAEHAIRERSIALKKILLYGISDKIGGIEATLLHMISHMEQDKVSFDVLTFYESIAYQEEYQRLGCKIYKITSKRKNPWKNRQELRRFFQQHADEYAAVWCNLAELINIDVLKLAKKYGIPKRIIHSHSTTSTRGKLLTRLHYSHRKKIGAVATDFWACTYDAGKWFYSDDILQSSRFQVIRNAIDLSAYAFNSGVREKIRQQYHLEDSFVVGQVGRLSIAQKNTLFLLEIFAAILKQEPNAVLMLVGDGPDRALVEQKTAELQLGDHLLMLGTRMDVPRLLNAMDAFVLPSFFEGLGIVLIEAQAAGLPSFASSVVPNDAAVTELLEFIPLQDGAGAWAKKILAAKGRVRLNEIPAIAAAGYDIVEEAKRIQKLLER